jgi:hypothetical protein
MVLSAFTHQVGRRMFLLALLISFSYGNDVMS